MLGRAYSLAGPVMRGDQLGRKIGFPTANLDPTGLILPPNGVYAAHAQAVPASAGSHVVQALACPHRAVVNIGYRPTLENPALQLRVEAHLLDFSGDLYEQELEITFIE